MANITQIIPPYSGTPPNRTTQTPSEFSDNADVFAAYFAATPPAYNAFAAQTNAVRDEVNIAADIAESVANYKGLWDGKTGAATVPASYAHNGVIWALNVNLANIAASEPSDSNPDWQVTSTLEQRLADGTADVGGVTATRVSNRVLAPFDDYLDVEEFGIPADGTDQTVAIQDVIDSYDGVGAKIKLLIRENLKFRLRDLSHSVFSDLTIKHGYSDDMSEPTDGLIGDSGIENVYTDKAVAGIADNYAGGYHSAPYHPAMVLDCRSDIPSPLVSSAQRQTMINGTYAIHREGRTKLQITYRDFDRQSGGLLETVAGKSGIDITLWREIYTTTGITSASWASPPVAGNLVETSTGKIFVVASIGGGGMTLYHRQGSLLVGEALIFNGVTSSTTITSRVRTSASKLNCFCVNSFNGASGNNIPPERLVGVNHGIGGIFGVENGSASNYGTNPAILRVVDNFDTPTLGYDMRFNATTGVLEFRSVATNLVAGTVANALVFAATTSGSSKPPLGHILPAYSLAQLRSLSNPINQKDKDGKVVRYVTDQLPVYSMGPLPADGWKRGDGTVLVATPDLP